MSTHVAIPDSALTPREHMQADKIANQVYSAQYSERGMAKLAIFALTGLSLILGAGLVIVSHRPAITRYVRIDDAGRAQAIQYSDLNYSPREGEIRTYLTDWTSYRHTINRETMAKKYPMNYFFLSAPLAAQLIGQDNANHLITQVTSGQMEQSETQVNNVTITSMTQEQIGAATVSRGTALENFDLIYSPRTSNKPRIEHWIASVTYYLNPGQVSDQAKTNPQYETINPLGLTITEFHENRMSVDATTGDGSTFHPEAKR
jgi:type IV secretion system protein VirB5